MIENVNNNLYTNKIYSTNLDLTNWLQYTNLGFYFQSPDRYRQFSDPNAFKLISKLFVQKKITLAQYELLLNSSSTITNYLYNNATSIHYLNNPLYSLGIYSSGLITYTT